MNPLAWRWRIANYQGGVFKKAVGNLSLWFTLYWSARLEVQHILQRWYMDFGIIPRFLFYRWMVSKEDVLYSCTYAPYNSSFQHFSVWQLVVEYLSPSTEQYLVGIHTIAIPGFQFVIAQSQVRLISGCNWIVRRHVRTVLRCSSYTARENWRTTP